MILILHVIVTIISVAYTTGLYFYPHDNKFRITYILAAGTVVSGTALVIDRASHIVESCLVGIVYIGAIFCAIVLARRKLILAEQEYSRD